MRARELHPIAPGLDREFDRLVPAELRHLSALHWTPVEVAVRAARLLRTTSSTRVLDIGSGIGKLCTLGALTAAGTWTGVEQQDRLVAAATEIARALGVATRTRFVAADAFALDWTIYDVLYFYNPFELALTTGEVERVEHRLAAMPPGTRIVTFHGFGGVMPGCFELLHHERVASQGLDLVVWRRRVTPRRSE